MRSQSITLIIVLVCFTSITEARVNAQDPHRFVIDIPFQFVVAGRTLPAGKYDVERADPTKPNLLMLKNTANGIVQVFITQRVENEEVSATSSLIFKRRGEEYYLFQVWTMGDKDGNQAPPAGEKNQRSSTLVRLSTTTGPNLSQ
jgi:hypothetical protein